MDGRTYDAVVGVGGGSVLDFAKLSAQNVDSKLAFRPRKTHFLKFYLPLILLPTTSETGSEVSPYAVKYR